MEFELVYQVNRAGWSALYDLRLDTEAAAPALDLGFHAQVTQQSGEDWDNVKIVLSTSSPQQGTEIPDPTQWWLYLNPKAAVSRSMGAASMNAAPMMQSSKSSVTALSAPKASMDMMVAAESVAATLQSSAFATNYVITRKKTIPSNTQKHRVTISESKHPASLLLVAVPRLQQAAFIEADIKYAGEEQLIPGPASIFRDGNFIGKTQLDAIAPGESFKLGFGQDDRVKVERKLLRQKDSDENSGWTYAKGERNYAWQTTISNFHKSNRTIEVREQLPKPRHEDIKVKEDSLRPKPEKEDPAMPGLKVWRLDIASKDKAVIDFNYLVRWPAGSRISGLE